MNTKSLDQENCIEKLISDTRDNKHPTIILKPTGTTTLFDGNPLLKGFGDIDKSDIDFIRSINRENLTEKFNSLKKKSKAYIIFQDTTLVNLKDVLYESLKQDLKVVFLNHKNYSGYIDFL